MQASLGIFLFVAGLVGSIQTAPTKPCAALGLLERIQPKAYFVQLSVDADGTSYSGMVDVFVTVNDTKKDEPKNVIVLNAQEDIEIKFPIYWSISSRSVNPILTVCRDEARQLLVLTLSEELQDKSYGHLTLIAKSKVRNGNKGIYVHKPTKDDNSLVKADFSNSGARLAIPCFDEPKYETTFGLSLVTGPGLIATSSSLEISERSSMADNVMLNEFKTTPPMQLGKVSFEVRPKETKNV